MNNVHNIAPFMVARRYGRRFGPNVEAALRKLIRNEQKEGRDGNEPLGKALDAMRQGQPILPGAAS